MEGESIFKVIHRVPVALFIEPLSASIDLQFHFAQLGTSTAIEWWARRMAPVADGPPHVIVHSSFEAQRIRRICGDRVNVFETRHSCLDAALHDFVRALNLPHVAVVTFGTAFAPVGLAARLFEEHLAGGFAATFAQGLPAGATPWIFSAGYLEMLRREESPRLPPHPGLAFRHLAGRARTEFRQEDAVYKEGCLNALHFSSADASELPHAIFWDSQEEIAIASEVLAVDENPQGLEGLKLWKRIEIRRIGQRFAPPRRLAAARQRPRILYLVNGCAFSGAEQSLYQLVREIESRGFDLYALLGAQGQLHDKLAGAGVNCTVMPDGFQEPSPANFLKIAQSFDTIQPDLIHANGIEGLPSLIQAISRGIPYIQHVRNGHVAPYKEYVEASTAVIAVSRYVRRKVLYFAVDPSKVSVVYDEVDTTLFRPGVLNKTVLREKYGLPPQDPLIVMIARYDPDKRHDLVLRAFEIVLRTLPHAKLALVGEAYRQNRYYDAVGKWINKVEFGGSVRLIPFTADIREVHAMSDVVVLGAENEGLGRCVVEAMAMGIPTVVTDASGTHEIVENGVSGIVVRHGDPELLAQGLLKILTNPTLGENLGANASKIAQREFTAAASASRITRVYEEVLGLKHKSARSAPATRRAAAVTLEL
jgi:glycosyltransferase involved in cell wall biosynthesis